MGHLPRWGNDALGLVEDGGRVGKIFELQLWRKALVGYSPQWNRLILGDLAGFPSRGGLSQLSPYLRGGVVSTEAPEHRKRREALNPEFHRRAVARFGDRFADLVAKSHPSGRFDARTWSSAMVRTMLSAAFFGGSVPRSVLDDFLEPLDGTLPGPLIPRPLRMRRMSAAIDRALRKPDPDSLAPVFAVQPDPVREARVALAAAYDTTAHTLAFALWELAGCPDLLRTSPVERVVQEALRLYPAGWIGSRVAAVDTVFEGRVIPAGRLVLYSPYLTHRDPELWPDPTVFRPERFSDPVPAWGYLPFAAGERTCLGSGLATLMLGTAIAGLADCHLTRVSTRLDVRGVVTLTPAAPIMLERRTVPAGRFPGEPTRGGPS